MNIIHQSSVFETVEVLALWSPLITPREISPTPPKRKRSEVLQSSRNNICDKKIISAKCPPSPVFGGGQRRARERLKILWDRNKRKRPVPPARVSISYLAIVNRVCSISSTRSYRCWRSGYPLIFLEWTLSVCLGLDIQSKIRRKLAAGYLWGSKHFDCWQQIC